MHIGPLLKERTIFWTTNNAFGLMLLILLDDANKVNKIGFENFRDEIGFLMIMVAHALAIHSNKSTANHQFGVENIQHQDYGH